MTRTLLHVATDWPGHYPNVVAALDALLDAGADTDADGAVIADGAPLRGTVAFAQWQAARRLVDRAAQVSLFNAAALGLLDRVRAHLAAGTRSPLASAGSMAAA